MIRLWLLFALSALIAPAIAQDRAPDLLPGSSEAFLRAVVRAEQDLQAGQFAAALPKIKALPDRTVTYSWSTTGLNAAQIKDFKLARDEAFTHWTEELPDLKFVETKASPDVKFTFVPSLPATNPALGPAGATFFDSYDPSDPGLEVVLSLTRTSQKTPITAREIYNETVFAIGRHFGLGERKGIGVANQRVDGFYNFRNRVAPLVVEFVRYNLSVVDALRKAATAKVRLKSNQPNVTLTPTGHTFEPALQGDQLEFTLTFNNSGSGPLLFEIVPDCGCFRIPPHGTVEAQSTGFVKIQVDTTSFPGTQHKDLYIYTNDPEQPFRVVPVNFVARPHYRLITNVPGDTFQLMEDGGVAELFLLVDPSRPFNIKSAEISGRAGMVEFQPWTGVIADREIGEAATQKQGFRIRALLSADQMQGREMLTLAVTTDDPKLAPIYKSFYVQRGIAILNPSIFAGNVKAGKLLEMNTLIVRPDKPFKILSVTSKSPALKATLVTRQAGHEYQLLLSFTPPSEPGMFEGTILLKTDDPAQPELTVKVSAMVR